jgi:hypothetical protein
MENMLKKYQDELNTTTNPASVLARFYCESLHQTNSVELIKMFNRLVKMYGRQVSFNSILSLYDMSSVVDYTNIYPLLAYFCKKELNKQESTSVNLSDYIAEREKQLESMKGKKFAIPKPFKGES